MAGDWIKMRTNLWDDPRVSAMVDATDTSEAQIIGGLYWLWSAADQHSTDGLMPGLSVRQIDRKTGIAGFGKALCGIQWLRETDEGIVLCKFDEHNGSSAKKRCQTAARVSDFKSKQKDSSQVTQVDESGNATSVTAALPRYREDIDQKLPASQDAAASSDPTEPDPVWGSGLAFLIRKGIPEKQARPLLGKVIKAAGDVRAAAILQAAEAQDIVDPGPWLMAAAARAREGPAMTKSRTMQGIDSLEEMKRELTGKPDTALANGGDHRRIAAPSAALFGPDPGC